MPEKSRIDRIVREVMERQCIPGLSLAVMRSGEPVLAAAWGLANVELGAPATPGTVYQIQSITKSFTATGIMVLEEEGRLDVGRPVGAYLDGTPESWSGIALRHLLSHTSGIKDFINDPTASLRLDVTEEEVLRATVPRPLNFAPGERYAYSNTNYHLLAMVLRRLTGKTWGDFLRERIFEPLGMSDTRVIRLDEIIPNRASGYAMTPDGLRNGGFIAPSVLAYGGGGLRSTVLDMAKWDAALSAGRVLKRETLEEMWASAKLNDGKDAGYGFGWRILPVRGRRRVTHSGAHSTGFATTFHRFLDDQVSVVAFSNRFGAGLDRLAQQVAGVFVPDLAPAEIVPIEDREPEVAARLAGICADAADGKPIAKQFADASAEAIEKALRQWANDLGALRSLVLVERATDGGRARYRYLASFQRVQFLLALAVDGDGRIAELAREPY